MTEFELLSGSVEWHGRLLQAGRETYRYPDGSENTFDKVWHPGAVTMIPLDTEHVWLVRQPREAAGLRSCLELPAGKRDRSGESPLELAKRELIEEVGKEARTWQELYGFFPTPGFCDEYMTLFAATGLSDTAGRPGARGGRAHRDRALAPCRPRRRHRRDGRRKDTDRAALARPSPQLKLSLPAPTED